MRHIRKGPEPSELKRYRQSDDARYDGPEFTPVKQAMRDALCAEQGYLCCYCLQRIVPEAGAMNVEHWQAQSSATGSGLTLTWSNLLGACPGKIFTREGRVSATHCDHRKGDQALSLDPTNIRHISTLSYGADGSLRSSESPLQREIDETLGLNSETLKGNRKQALDEVLKCVAQGAGAGRSATPAMLDKLIDDWDKPDSHGHLRPNCELILFWLRKRRKRV